MWTVACQASLSFTISGVCSNSCPLSWWCQPAFASSVVPFSSCPQSFPAFRVFSNLLHPLMTTIFFSAKTTFIKSPFWKADVWNQGVRAGFLLAALGENPFLDFSSCKQRLLRLRGTWSLPSTSKDITVDSVSIIPSHLLILSLLPASSYFIFNFFQCFIVFLI